MYRRQGFYYFLTLTAPGNERHRKGRSGKWCMCTPEGGVDPADWNPTMGACWNRFLTAARDHYRVRPAYFSANETQKRGALHRHPLLWSPRKLSKPVLRQLAIAAGFGHEIELIEVAPGSGAAARYVSKYVTKSSTERPDVPWRRPMVADDGTAYVQVEATYRTWSSSRSWGSTLKQLRQADIAKLERLRAQGWEPGRRPAVPGAVMLAVTAGAVPHDP